MKRIVDRRAIITALLSLVWGSSDSFAQGPPPPYLCRQWDDAFLAAFYSGTALFTLAAAMIVFFSGLATWLFPPPWWSRRPSWRMLVTAVVVSVLAILVFVTTPSYQLGAWAYGGVDPAYRLCSERPFGAQGLLGGSIGAGQPALSQKTSLVLFIITSIWSGTILMWLFGHLKARSTFNKSV